MSGLSEGEVHVQAMRLVCEALADREKTGLEVDWDVINQQLDHMDVILQGIADQRVDDADEIKTLRKELDAAQAETFDVRRQRNNETDRLNATNAVSVQQRNEIAYLRARLDEERSVSAGLRQQLDAANAAQALWQADSNLLERFAATVRSRFNPGWTEDDLPEILSAVSAVFEALAELDASTTEPTSATEPGPCPECERLRAELETANEHRTDLVLFVDKVRKSFRVWGGDQSFFDSVSHALDELDTNSSATLTSSVVKESLTPESEGGA